MNLPHLEVNKIKSLLAIILVLQICNQSPPYDCLSIVEP